MEKQTFINNMTGRGYKLRFDRDGNIIATKGENTVRLVPFANHITFIDTPTATGDSSQGRN